MAVLARLESETVVNNKMREPEPALNKNQNDCPAPGDPVEFEISGIAEITHPGRMR
jgi:hypothetical protein